ncbi:MAG: alpha-E domain-containing protein [Candidatus Gastranaerophilales bacterium]|nr:alpha-E domain-containing protein [Candidatus Gastranaerophilales bacterium]
MLSRVADSLFWISRYIERAENTARIIDVNLNLLLDLPGEERLFEPVIKTAGCSRSFYNKYSKATSENVMDFLTFDTDNQDSIVNCVSFARENARCIRETITLEMWMLINKFYHRLHEPNIKEEMLNNPHDFFTEIKEFCQLYVGIQDGTMSHGIGWNFAWLGRMLERADQTSRILDVKYYILLPDVSMVGMTLDTVQWTAVLKSVSAFEMFRKTYAGVTPQNVAEFLILNKEFPRSVYYCLEHSERALQNIITHQKTINGEKSMRVIGKLKAMLEFATVDEIIMKGLHETTEDIQIRLSDFNATIRNDFIDCTWQV